MEKKKKDINKTNLAEAYGNMTLIQFKKHMPELGFDGDLEAAHKEVSARAKATRDKEAKIAERIKKEREAKIAKRKKLL